MAIDGQRVMVESGYRAPGQRSLRVSGTMPSKRFWQAVRESPRNLWVENFLFALISTRSISRAGV